MSQNVEILIDAYNVMFAHPQIGPLTRADLDAARVEFLALVRARQAQSPGDIFVVFDAHRAGRTGAHPRQRQGRIQTIYARETADTWIQNRLRRAKHPENITVVTSDREILNTAEAHGASIIRVKAFLALPKRRKSALPRRSEKPQHQSRKEIARWEELFRKRKPDED